MRMGECACLCVCVCVLCACLCVYTSCMVTIHVRESCITHGSDRHLQIEIFKKWRNGYAKQCTCMQHNGLRIPWAAPISSSPNHLPILFTRIVKSSRQFCLFSRNNTARTQHAMTYLSVHLYGSQSVCSFSPSVAENRHPISSPHLAPLYASSSVLSRWLNVGWGRGRRKLGGEVHVGRNR
jgi:hypothetical protein